MGQHIVSIKNWGPIKQIDFNLDKDFQILIGVQASGKSTIAKTCYFCRKVKDYTLDFITYKYNFINPSVKGSYFNSYLRHLRIQFMGCFGTTKHLRDFEINYTIGNNPYQEKWIRITLEDKYVRFQFSPRMFEDISTIIEKARKSYTDESEKQLAANIGPAKYTELMKRQHEESLNQIFEDDMEIIYVPAARSLISQIPDTLRSLRTNTIDLTMKQFIDKIDEVKADMGTSLEDAKETYENVRGGEVNDRAVSRAYYLVKSILKADYHNDIDDETQEKLYFDESHWVKLMYSSSGQQEALWILMLCYMHVLSRQQTFMIIEEPEAHLFPVAVREMVQMLALLVNTTGSHVIITTHNPYVLTSANILLLSGRIEGLHPKEDMPEGMVVDPLYRLDYKQFAAFRTGNGGIVSIMDNDTHMVDIGYIDAVSDDANEKMDQLITKEVK